MKTLLAIESSGFNCSVALLVGDKIYSKEAHGKRSHTEFLLGFIDELFVEAEIGKDQLDAMAFSAGPGGFTGIRLASSIAKSFAYALDIPVIAVSTLEAGAYSYLSENNSVDSVTVVSDARMDDVYCGSYQRVSGVAQTVSSVMLKKISADELLSLEAFNAKAITTEAVITDAEHLCQTNTSIEAHKPSISALELHATAIAKLGEYYWRQGASETALAASAIYLRDKTSWKNTEQQQQDKNNK
jgi:tRNA threonylcarbamoyladenosine biosynthesis protein TsaB